MRLDLCHWYAEGIEELSSDEELYTVDRLDDIFNTPARTEDSRRFGTSSSSHNLGCKEQQALITVLIICYKCYNNYC